MERIIFEPPGTGTTSSVSFGEGNYSDYLFIVEAGFQVYHVVQIHIQKLY